MQIKPLSKEAEYLPDDTPILATKDILNFEFTDTIGSNEELRITIHWGLDGVDKSEVGSWIPTDLGTLIFDDKFDVSPPANQLALLTFC